MSRDTSKMPSEKTPGYGIIRIDRRGFTELFHDLDIKNTDLQGKLHDDGVMETIHQRLRLPESYKVLGIYIEYQRMGWCAMVESLDLEPTPEEREVPELIPLYRRNEDGSTVLLGIEVRP